MNIDIVCIITVLGGAYICQLLSLNRENIQGITPFLRRFYPGKSKKWYFRVNSIFFPVIGTLLAYILLNPTDLRSSFLAGITWCGSLQSFGIFLDDDQKC